MYVEKHIHYTMKYVGFFKSFASNINWKELCKVNLGQKKNKKQKTTNHLRDAIVSFSRGYDNQGKG